MSGRSPTLSSAAAIGYVAAKKQEEMEAAAVGLQHATITDQLIDLKKALDNNLLTQEEYDLQRSRVLGTEIVEPVLVKVAIAPRVNNAATIEMQTKIVAAYNAQEKKEKKIRCALLIGVPLLLAFIFLLGYILSSAAAATVTSCTSDSTCSSDEECKGGYCCKHTVWSNCKGCDSTGKCNRCDSGQTVSANKLKCY